MKEKLISLKEEITNKIGEIKTIQELNDLKTIYLGKKGPVQELSNMLRDLTVEEKLRNRECIRLELSLKEGAKHGKKMIVMLHYPPFGKNLELFPDIKDILEKYGVDICIYGHLHAEGHKRCINENIDGVTYKLVSADFLNFAPIKIA